MASQRLTLEAGIVTFERPDEVLRAVASCRRPEIARVVVLDSGSQPPVISIPGTRTIRSEVNVGPCAARNAIVEMASSDLMLFLDDDAFLDGSSDLERVIEIFHHNPLIAVVAGVEYRGGSVIAKHEFPRRRVVNVQSEGLVGYFVEGACVVRRAAFIEAGGFDPGFFYGHEGTDMALRMANLGYRIWYTPALRLEHRPSSTGRVSTSGSNFRQQVNREVLAARNLPPLFRWCHLVVWKSFYSLSALRGGLAEFQKHRHGVAAERRRRGLAPQTISARRSGYAEAWKLQRTGYRVLW